MAAGRPVKTNAGGESIGGDGPWIERRRPAPRALRPTGTAVRNGRDGAAAARLTPRLRTYPKTPNEPRTSVRADLRTLET